MDVYISIKSSQEVDGKKESMELVTYGELFVSPNSDNYVIIYNECELYAGLATSVRLDVTGNEVVQLNRSGDVANVMTMERGKKHHCYYNTPYGSIFMGVSTNDIHSEFTPTGLDLHLNYTLDINSTLLSLNEMTINVKECVNE